jgi:hypothetical protein
MVSSAMHLRTLLRLGSLGTKVAISSANPFNLLQTTFKHTVAYHLQHYH